ncbi:MAG: STAS domain-containing protein [Rhodocyclaceae bacterium]|nr:STAS domain-containing protein [Rhodocyclaceae bacterium]
MRGDLTAGVSVALVMIPQSLAYAQLAGFPAHYGLYAAMLPALVAALFGSAPQLSTGPVALTGMLTLASIAPLAPPGSAEFITLGVLLALLAGLIQLSLGALRQGWVLNLLSRPVFSGFINAAALLICLSQLPALVGIDGPHAPAMHAEIARIAGALGAPHLPTLAFGGLSLAALIALNRLAPRWPGVLIVVVASILVSAHTGFEAAGGAVVGAIPAGLPPLSLPTLPGWTPLSGLLPAAFVLALVSFLEAASSCKPITERTRQPWDENQELIGQGLAKIAAAFSGTLPTSGSFSRSALSYATGARSGLSQLVTVAVVLAATLSLSHTLYHLPDAVLAAIIIHAIVKLLDFQTLRRAWRIDADDGLAASATFVATLVFAPHLQNGILTGLLLSLSLLIWRSMKPRVALLGLHPDATYRDLDRFDLAHPHPAIVVLRFDGPLHFVNAARFTEAIDWARQAQPGVRVVLLSAAGINAVDATGLDALRSAIARLAADGQSLALYGLKKQVIDRLERDGQWSELAAHASYRHEQAAIDALLAAHKGFDKLGGGG